MKNLVRHLKSILGFPGNHTREPLSFEAIFNHFRDVLDSNNRAIEIITDIGEKLGGDYLFDIIYIRRAYSELSTAVHTSMLSFDVLTRNRYLQIHDVFGRIDNRIEKMMLDALLATGDMVVFYEDIAWDMHSEVGGKNANIAELRNYLKADVPEGFVITTLAFDEFVRHNNLSEKIESVSTCTDIAEPVLNELRNMIINAEIPPGVELAIDNVIGKMRMRCGTNCFVAMRSSAEEEDSALSFAGQFETALNVPLEGKTVKEAYKKVLSSLYSLKAAAYRRHLGCDMKNLKMAVGCMVMVDAASSGVIYSSNPDGDRDILMINATWGLGSSVVEGQTDADLYIVRKSRSQEHRNISDGYADSNPEIMNMKAGRKRFMTVGLEDGGVTRIKTPDDIREKNCLTAEQVLELATQAIRIEKHFQKPQDIEWAIDKNGKIFILQSRPLRMSNGNHSSTSPISDKGLDRSSALASGGIQSDAVILMKDKGIIVQKGIGAGKVFILRRMDELHDFPKGGAVLVARHDSSDFVRIMPYVSAIITDVGTPTSHMASLCREFRIPTIVNADDATQVLKHGQEITLYADDEGNVTVYGGIISEILEHNDLNFRQMEDIYEFRRRRLILRYISPLNLVDPLLDNFTTEGCRTIHDILRFIHEKSVTELVESARYGEEMLRKKAAVKLDIPVPAGIMVIDIGGGLNIKAGKDRVTFDQIESIPLRAVIKGMIHPGAWNSEPVSLRANDFFTSIMRMSDIVYDSHSFVKYNVAVASREYLHLSLKFGYHFNMLDCYCSENVKNNHIYFRFVGGAADIVKRSRRIDLIAIILREYGFNIKTKGDLIIARLANLRQDEMEDLLDKIGRLMAYTRQLDVLLRNDETVERYARNFIEKKYGSSDKSVL